MIEHIRSFKLFKRISKKLCTVYIIYCASYMKRYRSIILFLQSNIILFRLETLLVLHFCLQVSRLWIIYASNSNLISMTMCIPSISKICYSVLFSKRRKNRGSILAIAFKYNYFHYLQSSPNISKELLFHYDYLPYAIMARTNIFIL